MSLSQHVIAIYIHPDVGPITPVEIDMMQVEAEALKWAAGSDYDEIRLQEVYKRIKAQCPLVEPEKNRQGIASIIARLRNVYNFNGVVLRLPGNIEEKPASTSNGKSQPDELERLTREVKRLKRDFEREQQTNDARLQSFVDQIKSLKSAIHKANIQVEGLEAELQGAKSELYRTQMQLNQSRGEVNQLSQENAELQVRLEQAMRTEQSLSRGTTAQTELSLLRQRLTSAEQAEQQLRQTLQQREQEIKKLRDQVNRLNDDIPSSTIHEEDDFSFHLS